MRSHRLAAGASPEVRLADLGDDMMGAGCVV